jgi:hypothetical protein
MAAIARAQHVLGLDKDVTANKLVNLQLDAKFSGAFVSSSCDDSKSSVVRCIAESLKTHEVMKLESDHCNVEIAVPQDFPCYSLYWLANSNLQEERMMVSTKMALKVSVVVVAMLLVVMSDRA